MLALVDVSALEATAAANLAGEPRGSLVLDDVPATGALLTAAQAEELRARFALARAVQLAAALEQVLAWTVQYAGERVQFGRPLGKFQAIQMELAEMAGEVTAVTALTDAAVQAVERGENVVLAARRRQGAGRARRSRSWPGWRTRCTARSGSRRSTSCTTSPGGCGRGATRPAASWHGRGCWARGCSPTAPTACGRR